MKETGILMIDEMRDAAIADRKTNTRRVVVPQPPANMNRALYAENGWAFECTADGSVCPTQREAITCPYGGPGDRLYLKEDVLLNLENDRGARVIHITYRMAYNDDVTRTFFWSELDGATCSKLLKKKTWGKWTSKLLMYKFLARIWFELTDVRVERVQDISPEDAEAEGVYGAIPTSADCTAPEELYRMLWDRINKDRGFSFSSNPYVWSLHFKRIK